MKISKSLLQAIALGVTIGTTTVACESLKKENEDMHTQSCPDNCTIDHAKTNQEPEYNCPACGMG